MRTKRILFRVEGNDIVGHGHFMRCLTIARYLQQDFDCVFAMSTASNWVTTQLEAYNVTLITLTAREQFHPDDPRSSEPWSCDVTDILQSTDIMILDGYRFDSTFHEAAKRIGAKTIRIIDDLEGPADCSAIITQLPIAHSVIQAKLGINTAWTGLDGFLVRPEFYAAQKMEVPIRYDFFIYVTTPASFDFYSTLPVLEHKKVFALAPVTLAKRFHNLGWELGHHLPAQEIAQKMNESKAAVLPASTIAIEYLVVTKTKPIVVTFVSNQKFSQQCFVQASLWITKHSQKRQMSGSDLSIPRLNLLQFIVQMQ